MHVAIDEMSHLVAVWNITSALGGAPRFGRTNFPLDPGYLPAGVVVKLAPFSPAVIQHFIHLERPSGSQEPEGEGFAAEVEISRTPLAPRLTPAGFDYTTVGIFYETLGADLRALVARLGEEVVFSGDPGLQLSPAEVGLAGAKPVGDLASALAAFEIIIIDGEGAPEHSETSHFQRFIAIREEYLALRIANPIFEPAHPAAHNPVLRKPPRPEGRVWLEEGDAVATVDLANATYALMLRLMAGPSNPGCNAGVSFTALREAAALPPGPNARRFYIERMDELADAAQALDQAKPRCAAAARTLRSLVTKLRDAPAPSDE